MAKKLENGFYAKPGGYELYRVDGKAVLDDYNRTPNKGVKVWTMVKFVYSPKRLAFADTLCAFQKLNK